MEEYLKLLGLAMVIQEVPFKVKKKFLFEMIKIAGIKLDVTELEEIESAFVLKKEVKLNKQLLLYELKSLKKSFDDGKTLDVKIQLDTMTDNLQQMIDMEKNEKTK